MVKVQTTLFENPIDVPADEVEVLRNQGLLRGEPAPADPSLPDVTGGEPGITVAAADKPAGPAGEKPDAKEPVK